MMYGSRYSIVFLGVHEYCVAVVDHTFFTRSLVCALFSSVCRCRLFSSGLIYRLCLTMHKSALRVLLSDENSSRRPEEKINVSSIISFLDVLDLEQDHVFEGQ